MVDVWVFTVSGELPDNWNLGRDNKIWATTKRFAIEAGDLLLYREGGKSCKVLALAQAAEAATEVTNPRSLPWQSPGDPIYRYQWALTDIREPASPLVMTWREIQDLVLGQDSSAQAPRKSQLPYEEVLANLSRKFRSDLSFPAIDAESDLADPTYRRGGGLTPTRRRFDRDQRTGTPPQKTGEVADSRDAVADGASRHESLLYFFKEMVEAAGAMNIREGIEDIVWDVGDVTHIAEMKSTSGLNEVAQMRLGLGQILEYLVRDGSSNLQGWLVVEAEPREAELWTRICQSVGIQLWWPGLPIVRPS